MPFVTGPLPTRLKLIHGFGSVAFGVKDSGFSFFLLLYYNQVLGMDAGLVSLALVLALLVDAVIDPVLGALSDRTYTKWGRRLPWLYAAPIPLAVVWVMLWSPPSGDAPSWWGLFGIAVVVRILLSACEVPSVSLVPEITADYDDRTTLFRYRFLSGWTGGLLMMVMAYYVFMPTPEALLDREGYLTYGIFGAALMALSVMGSAWGQHKLVAHLPERKPGPLTFRGIFGEIIEAFSERAFVIWGLGALAAYVNQGMTFSISNYVNLFVWQFDGLALRLYPIVLFFSVVLMFFIVGPLHRRYGKPKSAAWSAVAAMVVGLAPYALFLGGLWPQPGTSASTALLYCFLFIANTLGVVTMVSATSMIAEIVEAFEERQGRRAEGAFYSGNWFVQKCATGMGIFLTGQIVAAAGLASDARQGAVSAPVLDHIIWYYGGATIVLALISAYWLGRFPIDRAEHEERLKALDMAARGDIDGGTIVP